MALRFNPPPNWPAPPANWTPTAGWEPEPSWGPIPEGWTLWVEDTATADAPATARGAWVARHKVLTGIAAGAVLIIGIAVASGGGSDATAAADPVTAVSEQPTTAPPVAGVAIPDVVGMTYADAQAALVAAGFTVVDGKYADSPIEGQVPKAAAKVPDGTLVSLTAGVGPTEQAEKDAAAAQKKADDDAKAAAAAAAKAEADRVAAMSVAQRNAVDKAQSYLDYSGFSRSGLIKQLEFEGYSTEDATFGADNSGADWNAEAAEKAKSYMDYSSFSASGLRGQMAFEGFTPEQIAAGLAAVGY